MYTLQKLQNYFRSLVYHLLLFSQVQPTIQSTVTGVTLCYKKVGRPCPRRSLWALAGTDEEPMN